MDGLRITKILAGLRNPELYLMKLRQGSQNAETTLFGNNPGTGVNGGVNANNLLSNFSQALQTNNGKDNNINQLQQNIQQNSNINQQQQQNIHNLWGQKNTSSTAAQNNLSAQNNTQSQQINNHLQNTQQSVNNQINTTQQNNLKNTNNVVQNLSQNINPENIQKNIVQNAVNNLNQTTQNEVAPNDAAKNITSYTANKQTEIQLINKQAPVLENDNKVQPDLPRAKADVSTNSRSDNARQVTVQSQASQLSSMDRSVYIKNLLGLPQTLGEILFNAQNKVNPIGMNTLMLNNLNQEMLSNQKMLSQIFNDKPDIPLTITTGVDAQILQQTAQAVQATQKDAVMLLFSGMIHMPAIAEMINKNGKQAAAQLIIAMASSSKNGMSAEEIRETLSILNSCVAMADTGNPVQTLKSLMLLYLPWLPLNEGVGFDLEVEAPDGENSSVESKLTVLVQTRNFGNVKGVFTLTTSNSVDIYIICSEDFPKRLLQKSLQEESTSHAMNTTIDIDSVTPIKKEIQKNQEAKVNLSATNEMNPYLLLMAHAFIRNTIYIDSNGIIEDFPNAS